MAQRLISKYGCEYCINYFKVLNSKSNVLIFDCSHAYLLMSLYILIYASLFEASFSNVYISAIATPSLQIRFHAADRLNTA